MKDPYIDEELVRIQIETYEVHFVFTDTLLQVKTNFSIVRQDQVLVKFNPAEQQGDLVTLWHLIGCKVKDVTWENEVIILFYNDCAIKIPEITDHIRGSIVSRNKIEGKIFWQDF